MPSAWRAHVIGERLRQEGMVVALRECDVYSVGGDERHAVLNALVAEHADFPMVLVAGTVACHGGIDLGAVIARAREVADDDGCRG